MRELSICKKTSMLMAVICVCLALSGCNLMNKMKMSDGEETIRDDVAIGFMSGTYMCDADLYFQYASPAAYNGNTQRKREEMNNVYEWANVTLEDVTIKSHRNIDISELEDEEMNNIKTCHEGSMATAIIDYIIEFTYKLRVGQELVNDEKKETTVRLIEVGSSWYGYFLYEM